MVKMDSLVAMRKARTAIDNSVGKQTSASRVIIEINVFSFLALVKHLLNASSQSNKAKHLSFPMNKNTPIIYNFTLL